MQFTKTDFIQLALSCNVLKFGDFILKSGRKSPYFFNAGAFYHGSSLKKLGQFYANTLVKNQVQFQHLFGPAYKGLPLATSTAIALASMDIETTVTFNRKEIKDHGEGGQLIGAPLHGNTVIVDDVITAGTAFREAQQLIHSHGGQLTAVIIALDRCERGLQQNSAIADIMAQGVAVYSIINLFDLINYLEETEQDQQVARLKEYQEQHGY